MSKQWKITQLGVVADITMGQSPDSITHNTDEIGLPFLQGCAEFGTSFPDPKLHCFPPLRVSKRDSILISVRAPVGKMNWCDQDYCIGRGLGSIKSKIGVPNTHFLKHVLDQNVSFLHRRSQGSTFLAVGGNDLKIFPVPEFPERIQVKIASVLNTIDQAIEKTEALIHKYEQIKAGLMHDLFTRGLTADGKLRPPREQAPQLYQETPIGWIPKEWEVKTLGEIVHFQRGHDIVESQFVGGDFPVVSSGGVIGHHNQYTTRAPNVVVGRKGTIGKVHFLDVDFWAHDTSLYATDFHGNEPLFVFFLCVWLDLGRFGTKSGSPSLNRNDIHPIEIASIQPDEQKLINLRLLACDKKIESLNENFKKLAKLKSGLMHDLLTGKVPVNVNEEEPAHV